MIFLIVSGWMDFRLYYQVNLFLFRNSHASPEGEANSPERKLGAGMAKTRALAEQ